MRARDQVCGNAAGLVDGRKAASRMGSPAGQITVSDLFELVARPETDLLRQVVREVESRPVINVQVIAPFTRANDFFFLDVRADVFHR